MHRAPGALPPLPSGLRKGRLPSAAALGIDEADLVPEPVAEPGEPAARAALERWLRDEPRPLRRPPRRHVAPGTSVLSPYLRWGCLSARECEERAAAPRRRGAAASMRQLAWRDFYAHQLLLFPDNVQLEFQARYRRRLAWSDDEELLEAWRAGRTGYPLVDAGMRQLRRAPAGCTTARGSSSARS